MGHKTTSDDRWYPLNSTHGGLSLLLNLEAARQGRSVLFSDEQKLLFKGGKKGVC